MTNLLLPPASFLFLALFAVLLRRWRPRLGLALFIASWGLLWAAMTPLIARWQIHAIAFAPPQSPLSGTGARAMIVLGGGSYADAPEYGADTVSPSSLERVRYAARLYRLTGTPIMVSGGNPTGTRSSEAEQMRDVLIQELTTPVTWLESTSNDTLESAVLCEKILHEEGIRKVLLVTHSFHMRRARAAFEHAGLEVVPAPLGYSAPGGNLLAQLVPNADALRLTHRAWREALGLAWYRIRFWFT